LLPVLLNIARRDIAAINIEVAVRNVNLALLLKASLFPAALGVADPMGDTVLFVVFFYGTLALPLGVAQIFLYSRNNRGSRQLSAA